MSDYHISVSPVVTEMVLKDFLEDIEGALPDRTNARLQQILEDYLDVKR